MLMVIIVLWLEALQHGLQLRCSVAYCHDMCTMFDMKEIIYSNYIKGALYGRRLAPASAKKRKQSKQL